jgi:hypothetical protein
MQALKGCGMDKRVGPQPVTIRLDVAYFLSRFGGMWSAGWG